MDNIRTDAVTLRKFGFILAGGFILISLTIFAKHKYSAAPISVIALSVMLLATFTPASLRYFYMLWMKLAYILSWINTRILLGIVFYLVFSPVGLFMRLFRIDPLERKFKPFIDSYWKLKDPKRPLPADYHRQS